jgi:hypothetical protein
MQFLPVGVMVNDLCLFAQDEADGPPETDGG